MWHQVQDLTAETGSKGTGITLKPDPGRQANEHKQRPDKCGLFGLEMPDDPRLLY